MSRPAAVEAALSGDGSCWCHANFGLAAVAYVDGLCGKCKDRSPTACLTAHTAERVKALEAADADLAMQIARDLDIELEVAEAVLGRLAGAA
jgi:hypothetical protein